MKTILIALALIATPAFAADNANFTGIRGELSAGVNDITRARDTVDVAYGASAGVDVPLGDNLIVGMEATADNVFDKNAREYGAAARVGYAFTPHVLGYAKAGYTDFDAFRNHNLDGLRLGAGIEIAASGNSYVKAEYRYSDFDGHQVGSNGALVGVGIRF